MDTNPYYIKIAYMKKIIQSLKFSILNFCISLTIMLAILVVSNNAFAEETNLEHAINQDSDETDFIISGNLRISKSSIKSYMEINKSREIDQAIINDAVKKLYATGFFSNIEIIHNKKKREIHVKVNENPVLKEIIIEGNDNITKEELISNVSMKIGDNLNKRKINDNLNIIKHIYRKQGYNLVKVDFEIKELEEGRINVIFNVKEGLLSEVKHIAFTGNKKFSSSKLRDTMGSGGLSVIDIFGWFEEKRFDPDRVEFNRELLRRFYENRGYIDFKVTSTTIELTPDSKDIFITFAIHEGKKYNINDIDISSSKSNLKLSDADIKEIHDLIKTKKGDIYNYIDVQTSIDEIVNYLGDKGFAFVDVEPIKYKAEDGKKTVDILYSINEGPRVYIESINIAGNTVTLDKVIRREMKLAEGDPYSSTKIKRSRERIENLGFFNKVEFDIKPGSDKSSSSIDIKVTEKSTGKISIGGGYSTTVGTLIDFGIEENNLLGTGQKSKINASISERRKKYNISLTEPYLMGRDISLGVNIFNIERDLINESSFRENSSGLSVVTGYSPKEYWRHNIYYSYRNDNIQDTQSTASRYIREQEGHNVSSKIGHSIKYDSRNNRFDPKNGLLTSLEQSFVGVGGDSEYISHNILTSYYYGLTDSWILNLVGRFGILTDIGQKIRINERLFLGSSKIRGFDNSGVGPRDTVTKDALGGQIYYVGSVNINVPLGDPRETKFQGSFFVDFGSLYDSPDKGEGIENDHSLRVSTGVGISWRSPVGPIRIDFGIPLILKDYDEKELVRFSIGVAL